jgi:cytoplasmic iron level regulating protein YaaA (DUF328/UPF0246 family)
VDLSSLSVPVADERRIVIDALRRETEADPVTLAKLFGVTGQALQHAITVNRSIDHAPTTSAIDRYTGVLYNALDAATLDSLERRRLNRQVRIISGLWGALAPTDAIPDYKLKMGASLSGLDGATPTRLARFWRPVLASRLVESTGIDSRSVLWNLLPNEHAAAVGPLPCRRQISVKFYDVAAEARLDPGALRSVNHWNKLLKGALVRWVLGAQPDRVEALETFEHPLGYRWVPSLGTEKDGVHVAAMVRVDGDGGR